MSAKESAAAIQKAMANVKDASTIKDAQRFYVALRATCEEHFPAILDELLKHEPVNDGFNVNDHVWVRLTEDGCKCFAKYNESFPKDYRSKPPKPNEYIELQMWELMHIFGPKSFNGSKNLFVKNKIYFQGKWFFEGKEVNTDFLITPEKIEEYKPKIEAAVREYESGGASPERITIYDGRVMAR